MDQTESKQDKEKKNRIIPLIWLFGLGLTGVVITLGLLLNKKSSELNKTEQELANNRISFNNERDSLSKDLSQAKSDFNTLKTDYESLDKNLAEQKARSNRLAGENKSYIIREQQYKNDYATLQGSFDKLQSENELLKTDLVRQQSEYEALKAQLANRDMVIADQATLIDGQEKRIKSDSILCTTFKDSVMRENVSGYINITDLNGAAGLAIISVPYSHYLYGLTTVNGYVINKRFMTGIGIGLYRYNDGTAMPLFLDFRYNLRKAGFIPYIFADGGLMLKFEDLSEPIIFTNPGIGLYKKISDRFAINLGVGYLIQREFAKSSFINFKLGLMFWGNNKGK
jgi:uncharacterized membrane-anchored protein YhcB (DUF1043 family)